MFREGDVSQEAFKSIYGTSHQNDFEMASLINKSGMPSFVDMIKHVQNVASTIMTEKKSIVHIGGHALPFNINVYLEVQFAWRFFQEYFTHFFSDSSVLAVVSFAKPGHSHIEIRSEASV